MRSFAALMLGLWFATAGPAAVTAKKATPKKSSSKPAQKKSVQTAPARGRAAAAKKTSRARAKPSWRTSQMTPAPERYREIQQALIAKGYLAAPATGAWGPESVEALKRFEQDQNLNPDGKLDSLALIALGLGPRRETTAVPAKPNPAPRAPSGNPSDPLDIPTRREPQ